MTKKVIPKEQLTAYQRWELPAMMEEGGRRREGSPPRPPTAQEIEQFFQQAHAEGLDIGRQAGHAEGFTAGYQQGLSQGLREAAERVRLVESLLGMLAEPMARLDARVEQELLALALEIARVVIRREIEARPERLLPVIREAMACLPVNACNPTLGLHPQDAALLRELMPELEQQGVRIIEEAHQQRGGVRVMADGPNAAIPERRWHPRHSHRGESEVDARIENRWREVVVTLLGEELIS